MLSYCQRAATTKCFRHLFVRRHYIEARDFGEPVEVQKKSHFSTSGRHRAASLVLLKLRCAMFPELLWLLG